MGPELPDDVTAQQLDGAARARLRTLSRENADRVARHLVMAGLSLDGDPELAYEHAQAALRSAGRVDVVREAAGIAAYRTQRYAEALRELRTVRRLNGSSEHLPLMADCERGLGRAERAIALAATPEAETLDQAGRVELAIVVSGARCDLGEFEAALAVLGALRADGELSDRIAQARAYALQAAGRTEEAEQVLGTVSVSSQEQYWDDDVLVYDLVEDSPIADDSSHDATDAGASMDDEQGDEQKESK